MDSEKTENDSIKGENMGNKHCDFNIKDNFVLKGKKEIVIESGGFIEIKTAENLISKL